MSWSQSKALQLEVVITLTAQITKGTKQRRKGKEGGGGGGRKKEDILRHTLHSIKSLLRMQ